ncbi:hypothetical protein EVAR_83517_1 [Eumeta japonica]|uniref:Uncharacterized protein n=1 Tax=Eumeta variegata TaxID=151549 RepID=A0A4C1Y1C8_EUMVA|nr:hypothetical protein EVAR_83517_1 [Eumeta japonica]
MDKRLSVNEHVGFSPKRLNELSTTQPHYWLLLKCKLKYSITSGESIPHTNSSTGTSVQDEAEEITPQLARRRGALTLGKSIDQCCRFSSYKLNFVLIDVVSTFIDSLIILQQAIEGEGRKAVSYAPRAVYCTSRDLRWQITNETFTSYLVLWMRVAQRSTPYVEGVDLIQERHEHLYDLKKKQFFSLGEYQKTAKNVLRLCNTNSAKMRVCGLFTVDAALPLRLMGPRHYLLHCTAAVCILAISSINMIVKLYNLCYLNKLEFT